MDRATFWEIIETAHRDSSGDSHRQLDLLIERLARYSENAIVDFHDHFRDCMVQAYRTDVWDAACFVNQCVDVDFYHFRGWLIAQGQSAFEQVLEDADHLAEVIPADAMDLAAMISAPFSETALHAYRRITGSAAGALPIRITRRRYELVGKFRREDEFPQVYPRLAAMLSQREQHCQLIRS